MRAYIGKILILSVLVILTLAGFYLAFERDFSDRFYSKFLNPAPSMIVGSSRALLALDPSEIAVDFPQAKDMLNFAFTQRTSPYGEIYYNAIKRKLTDRTDGVFIVEVSPTSLLQTGDVLPEKKMVLADIFLYNVDPNPEYILRYSEHPLYLDCFSYSPASNQVGHADGWLENLRTDTGKKQEAKIESQIKEYDNFFTTGTVSPYRLYWLEETIRLLSEHGTVVMIRLPVSKKMESMEMKYCPYFDSTMEAIAVRNNVHYLHKWSDENYQFADLHHMLSASAKTFSRNAGFELNNILNRDTSEH